MENPCYFRIMINKEGFVVFPEMQDFDEPDYDQTKFLNEEKYKTESEAINAFCLMRMKAKLVANLYMEV